MCAAAAWKSNEWSIYFQVPRCLERGLVAHHIHTCYHWLFVVVVVVVVAIILLIILQMTAVYCDCLCVHVYLYLYPSDMMIIIYLLIFIPLVRVGGGSWRQQLVGTEWVRLALAVVSDQRSPGKNGEKECVWWTSAQNNHTKMQPTWPASALGFSSYTTNKSKYMYVWKKNTTTVNRCGSRPREEKLCFGRGTAAQLQSVLTAVWCVLSRTRVNILYVHDDTHHHDDHWWHCVMDLAMGCIFIGLWRKKRAFFCSFLLLLFLLLVCLVVVIIMNRRFALLLCMWLASTALWLFYLPDTSTHIYFATERVKVLLCN